MFSIKRLFYLSSSVKIQFFKTFMVPYFDYCLSLIIYFPKSTLQKLNNCFNNCIYKLFKLKMENAADDESYDENFNDYNLLLQKYGLFTLNHRIVDKVLSFAYKIKNNPQSPSHLNNQLNSSNTSDHCNNNSNNLKLRNREILIVNETSKFSRRTFSYFFKKLILNFSNYFELDYLKFANKISENINFNYISFSHLFPNLNVKYSSFNYLKKKKQ